MKKSSFKNQTTSLILAFIICFINLNMVELTRSSAASSYIKIEDYIKVIVTELNLKTNDNSKKSYIDAAIKEGIVKEGEYKDYNSYLTRTDCAVIANRMDRYINGISNYAPEVYELLSQLIYQEGYFYYNVEGDLCPDGANLETYDPSVFIKDEILSRLEPYFTFPNGLRAGYEDEGSGVNEKLYIFIGLPSDDMEDPFSIFPFQNNTAIVKAWNKIKDYDRKVEAVLNNRISDINKIAKNKRQDVAEAFAKGIITGYSNGMYVQSREYRGENKITASAAKSIVQKVLYMEKRSLVSPDGQLIRTTNLPKNAKDYPYILDAFPNSFYEMNYSFMYYDDFKPGKLEKSIYRYPSETTFDFLYDTFYKGNLSLGMDKYEYYDKALSQAKQYLECVFNMNYKTVDQAWIDKLASSYAPFGGDNIYDLINEYLVAAKKNHVVVESKLISVEPSTLYYDWYNLYVRAYVKYRITADDINVEEDDLVYGHNNYLNGLRKGEWRYGYYDIRLESTYMSAEPTAKLWGVHAFVNISDWALRMPY